MQSLAVSDEPALLAMTTRSGVNFSVVGAMFTECEGRLESVLADQEGVLATTSLRCYNISHLSIQYFVIHIP